MSHMRRDQKCTLSVKARIAEQISGQRFVHELSCKWKVWFIKYTLQLWPLLWTCWRLTTQIAELHTIVKHQQIFGLRNIPGYVW